MQLIEKYLEYGVCLLTLVEGIPAYSTMNIYTQEGESLYETKSMLLLLVS